MKSASKATAFLGAAFAIAALLYLYQSFSTEKNSAPNVSTNIGANPNTSNSTVATSRRKIFDAPTANALISAPIELQSPGEEAFIRLQIAQVCDPTLALQTEKPKSESEKVAALFRKSFCSGYSGSISSEQANLLSLPEDDPYQVAYGMSAELFDAVAQGQPNSQTVSSITKHLNEVMLSKDSRMEALLAAEALHQVGSISPQTMTFAKSNNWQLNPHDLAEVQLLSVQMRMCQKFGGCGPSQLTTMKLCSERSTCATGASADSIWRRSNSSAIYEAAQKLSTSNPDLR